VWDFQDAYLAFGNGISSGSALFVSKHVRRQRKIIDTHIRCFNTKQITQVRFSHFLTEFHATSTNSA
jgi:hypothetical protein